MMNPISVTRLERDPDSRDLDCYAEATVVVADGDWEMGPISWHSLAGLHAALFKFALTGRIEHEMVLHRSVGYDVTVHMHPGHVAITRNGSPDPERVAMSVDDWAALFVDTTETLGSN